MNNIHIWAALVAIWFALIFNIGDGLNKISESIDRNTEAFNSTNDSKCRE